VFPRDHFNLRSNGRGGFKRQSRCKKCHTNYSTSYRKINPEKVRKKKVELYHRKRDQYRGYGRRSLIRKLGLDPLVIEKYRQQHNGLCDICHNPTRNDRSLHMDHDHESLEFRGLLCSNCNTGIGSFKDSPLNLIAAALYLTGIKPDLDKIKIDEAVKDLREIQVDESDERAKSDNHGEKCSYSKLKIADVEEIRQMLQDGVRIAIIATKFNVSRMAIWLIKSGRNWSRD
jgi:hypothetical protein